MPLSVNVPCLSGRPREGTTVPSCTKDSGTVHLSKKYWSTRNMCTHFVYYSGIYCKNVSLVPVQMNPKIFLHDIALSVWLLYIAGLFRFLIKSINSPIGSNYSWISALLTAKNLNERPMYLCLKLEKSSKSIGLLLRYRFKTIIEFLLIERC